MCSESNTAQRAVQPGPPWHPGAGGAAGEGEPHHQDCVTVIAVGENSIGVNGVPLTEGHVGSRCILPSETTLGRECDYVAWPISLSKRQA